MSNIKIVREMRDAFQAQAKWTVCQGKKSAEI